MARVCQENSLDLAAVQSRTAALLGKVKECNHLAEQKSVEIAVAAEASQDEQDASMELDDDLLNQMAEAAVAPAGEQDADKEERKARVAEAKARLKSKKSELEQRGLAKVRKIGK